MATNREDQFYASRSGQIITVTPTGEPAPAVRKAGRVSAVDFSFDVTINLGEPQRVSVAVATEVLTDLWPWSQKPESLDVIGRGGSQEELPEELATDLCIARILEAIDRGVNFDEDFAAFPDSFLMIEGTPEPIERIATVERDDDIRDYISRRLYAARRACRKHHPQECSQFFHRPDWFYLKVGQPDFHHVITEESNSRWIIDPLDDFLLMWTDSLIREMREAERAAAASPVRTSGRDAGDRDQIELPTMASSDRATARVEGGLLKRMSRTFEKQMALHGPIWRVLAWVIPLIVGIVIAILS